MQTTPKYGFKKRELTDSPPDITATEDNWDKLEEQLTNLEVSATWEGLPGRPSSFPADGGNADTLDGKHASDFATSTHNHDSIYSKTTHTHTYPVTSVAGRTGAIILAKADVGLGNVPNYSASTSVSSTSTTTLATSSAVKQAYDLANSAFQSASSGKTAIADAITGKGVSASGSDTHATLANKITQIPSIYPTASTYLCSTTYASNYVKSNTWGDKYTITTTSGKSYNMIAFYLSATSNSVDIYCTAPLIILGGDKTNGRGYLAPGTRITISTSPSIFVINPSGANVIFYATSTASSDTVRAATVLTKS